MSTDLPDSADPRVWRAIGELLPPSGSGPLDGLTLAVKDLIALAGQRIGGGVPNLLAEAPVETRTAPAVGALLDAGAAVRGIAATDQLAYSIAGRNPFSGTPPNPAVPGGLPGGSSSGPASAVALGQADVGVGTDTGGSIRVPASYQGLWGLRPTHGAVPADGVLPLAPSFDTVGWLTRDGATLASVASVALAGAEPSPAQRPGPLVVAPSVTACATDPVQHAFATALQALTAAEVPAPSAVGLGDVADRYEAFRQHQAAEAWACWGEWLTAHPGAVVGDVAERFTTAAQITGAAAERARSRAADARAELDEALGQAVLLLPSAASPAPRTDADEADVQEVRRQTLSMTAIAGLTGRPALSVPVLHVGGAPVGLCLVGPRGSDLSLISLGRRVATALGEQHGRRA